MPPGRVVEHTKRFPPLLWEVQQKKRIQLDVKSVPSKLCSSVLGSSKYRCSPPLLTHARVSHLAHTVELTADAVVRTRILTACFYVGSVTENPRIFPSARSEKRRIPVASLLNLKSLKSTAKFSCDQD